MFWFCGSEFAPSHGLSLTLRIGSNVDFQPFVEILCWEKMRLAHVAGDRAGLIGLCWVMGVDLRREGGVVQYTDQERVRP